MCLHDVITPSQDVTINDRVIDSAIHVNLVLPNVVVETHTNNRQFRLSSLSCFVCEFNRRLVFPRQAPG